MTESQLNLEQIVSELLRRVEILESIVQAHVVNNYCNSPSCTSLRPPGRNLTWEHPPDAP